jgi:uncharacterized Zn finger protein
MAFTKKYSRLVESVIKDRGEAYFRQRRVNVVKGSARSLTATVRGTSNYEISLSNNGLSVSCDCPYYEENLEVCKHIWAAMLEAQRQGHLSAAAYIGPARIIYGEGEDAWDEED